jgi:hypothetical protein
MKKLLSGILCMLMFAALLGSCRKDYAREHFEEDIKPIKPDFTQKVAIDISGFVTDENNNPVFNAEITAGDKFTKTDQYGYFSVTNASVPEIAGFVKVRKAGYFPAFKTFPAHQDEEIFIRTELLPVNNPGNIDAAAGGAIDLPGGARLSLPSAAVVIASSGIAYAGAVHVAAHTINPTDISAVQLQSPGDTRAVDDEGHLRMLNTYGILAVELTGNAGEKLQIATGKQATITIPVPASLNAAAPATITLWSFDESNGLWKQEGTATKNGNNYTGTVSHFSFWTGATDIALVEFTAQIVNSALQPIANAAVGIRGQGELFNAGFGRFGYTDANGYVTGSIPAGRDLVLNVLTPCETEAYSHSFHSGNNDIDLGTITGNIGQGMVTISGTALNCSSQPITSGYVQVYDGGFNNRINIVNGTFSFTGLVCINTAVSYVAVDDNAHQQSTAQSISLVQGVNNLGTINACGISTVGSLTVTVDGSPTVMQEPADELNAYFNPLAGGWTTLVKINNPQLSIQFDGDTVTGTGHKVTEIFGTMFPGGRAVAPVPLTVTISEYAAPGGFVEGSFSGLMLDFPANGIHNVSCNFRIRRFQ